LHPKRVGHEAGSILASFDTCDVLNGV